jgi:hypothetical protein
MKRLILMAALAILILPPPAAGERLKTLPRTTWRGELEDKGREIQGHLEAQQKLQESIKKQSGEGYEDSMKQKRREKAKRLRGQGGRSQKSKFLEPPAQ